VVLACASKKWHILNNVESIYFVYIIRSTFKNWNYVGFTTDVSLRLEQHDSGLVKSTKFYKPFNLIFVQIVDDRINARKLEKFLKVRFNKEALLDIIS